MAILFEKCIIIIKNKVKDFLNPYIYIFFAHNEEKELLLKKIYLTILQSYDYNLEIVK